jgi:hypothetical protein
MIQSTISIKRDIKVGAEIASGLGLAVIVDKTKNSHKKVTDYHVLILCFVINLSITKYKKSGE